MTIDLLKKSSSCHDIYSFFAWIIYLAVIVFLNQEKAKKIIKKTIQT